MKSHNLPKTTRIHVTVTREMLELRKKGILYKKFTFKMHLLKNFSKLLIKPAPLSRMNFLKVLCMNVMDEPVSKGLLTSVVRKIDYHKKLKHIDIDFEPPYSDRYILGNYDLMKLSKGLQKLRELQIIHLNFRRCDKITNSAFSKLAYSISMLPNIKHLDLNLQRCQKAFYYLSDNISKLKYLECIRLDFTWCHVTSNKITNLFQQVLELNNLKSLELFFKSCSNISTINTIPRIPHKLSNKLSLEKLHLDFSGCSWVTDDDIPQLFLFIPKLKNLSILEIGLAWCCLSDKGVALISKYINELKNLSHIDFNMINCPISRAALDDLSMLLENHPKINTCKVSY